MHWLPDGAALRVGGGQFFEDLRRAGPAGLVDIACVAVGTDLLAHGGGVDEQAGQPEVRLHDVRLVRIHADWQILQTFFIPIVYSLLLGDVLLQIGDLAADDARDDVRHAVVVAGLLVLVPRRGLAGLRGPFPRLLGGGLVVRQQHAARRARDDLVAVEGDGVVFAEGPRLAASVGRAEALGGVLYQDGMVLFADGEDLVEPRRRAVEVREHDHLRLRMEPERFLERDGIHVPRLPLRVDEDGRRLFIDDGIDGRREGHVGAEDLVAGLHVGELHAEVQRGRPAGQRDGVPAADLLRDLLFHFVDIRPDGGHPVGLEGLLHVGQFRAVHGGRGKIDFFIHKKEFTGGSRSGGNGHGRVPLRRERRSVVSGNNRTLTGAMLCIASRGVFPTVKILPPLTRFCMVILPTVGFVRTLGALFTHV